MVHSDHKPSHADRLAEAYNQRQPTTYPAPSRVKSSSGDSKLVSPKLFQPGSADGPDGEGDEPEPPCGLLDALDMTGEMVSKAFLTFGGVAVDAEQAGRIAAASNRLADYLRSMADSFSSLHKK